MNKHTQTTGKPYLVTRNQTHQPSQTHQKKRKRNESNTQIQRFKQNGTQT